MKDKREFTIKLICYLAATIIAAAVAILYMVSNDVTSLSGSELYRVLCDAFTIPGLLYLLLWGLIWASHKGALDGLGFVFSNMFAALIPGMRAKRTTKYYDYVQLRRENRKPFSYVRFLGVVGGVFLLVAIVFLILFYH